MCVRYSKSSNCSDTNNEKVVYECVCVEVVHVFLKNFGCSKDTCFAHSSVMLGGIGLPQ